MLLKELLDRLQGDHCGYSGEEMTRQLVDDLCGYLDLGEHGFTSRSIMEWSCDFTTVGTMAIYHNGELICISEQHSHNDDVKFSWVDRATYQRIKQLVKDLFKEFESEDDITILDMNQEMGDAVYKLEFGCEILPSHMNQASWQGKPARICQVWQGYDPLNWDQAVIEVDGAQHRVKINELELAIPLKTG
jgi:hypothetical protein